jgi:hypothetical protein
MRPSLAKIAALAGLSPTNVINGRRDGWLPTMQDTRGEGVTLAETMLLLTFGRLKAMEAWNAELGRLAEVSARRADGCLRAFLATGEMPLTTMLVAITPNGERRHFFVDGREELAWWQNEGIEKGFTLLSVPISSLAVLAAEIFGLREVGAEPVPVAEPPTRVAAASEAKPPPGEMQVELVRLETPRTGIHASADGLVVAQDGRGMKAVLPAAHWRDLARRAAVIADMLDLAAQETAQHPLSPPEPATRRLGA